ncbi:MAG: glutathione S-transferase [Burkholderiales bacterium]
MPKPATADALPLLYSYRRCPYAMRARMALLQAGRKFQAFEIVLRDKPAALVALSTKATVPVLRLPDGHVLEESLDIMAWAFEANDPVGWWHRAQSADNVELLRLNDGTFKHHLDRYKYPQRFPQDTDTREVHRAQAMAALLAPLEGRLQRESFLGGTTACAADMAIFPFVRQFAGVEPAWFAEQRLPALQAWLSNWSSSALFMTCMRKIPTQTMVDFPALTA